MDASVNRIPSSRDERALLIALRMQGENIDQVQYSLEELKLLIKTAGGITVDAMTVNRDKIDAAYIIGKGYIPRLQDIIEENEIRLVVFDINNIRPAQIRNLEDVLKCRVIGRTEVILDIFARRARSAEAKIQVELAQLKYILPRLKGLGGVLSRLGGGIGTRGPGEKMLETDRRHIQRRIHTLDAKLVKHQKHRARTRSGRSGQLIGAVVGYTNAGKSTLINYLARDDLFVEDRLFATLDSYTRTVYIDRERRTLLTDTVGFIRNLPANLIESFRSTLEDIVNADYIIHVVDINAGDVEVNVQTVEKELATLDCMNKPLIFYFNKSDLLPDDTRINMIKNRYHGAVIGSVKEETGMEELRERLGAIHDEVRGPCQQKQETCNPACH
ncbi:MAG: GTPase HflX [Spirochaetae bacterium HGW-Spirochaetae-1]|jgi:GTP-binding protein HflX|nr:MAG: GTPase HflX [Spirochaetae bacterium HGW-Spirochaetae-1]